MHTYLYLTPKPVNNANILLTLGIAMSGRLSGSHHQRENININMHIISRMAPIFPLQKCQDPEVRKSGKCEPSAETFAI